MASAKSPAFQFYPSDWLSSTEVALMTPAQEGAYIRLLAYCWTSGDHSIPDNDDSLAVMSRLGEGWFNGGSLVLRACFIKHPTKPGFLSHKRILKEAAKQKEWRAKSAEGGRKSGEARRSAKGGSGVVQANANSSSSSPSSVPSSEGKPSSEAPPRPPTPKSGRQNYTVQFDQWWKLYPPTNASKKEAFAAYQKALSTGVTHEALIDAVYRYNDFREKTGTPPAHATTWLNRERWDVDYDAALTERQRGASGHAPRTFNNQPSKFEIGLAGIAAARARREQRSAEAAGRSACGVDEPPEALRPLAGSDGNGQ